MKTLEQRAVDSVPGPFRLPVIARIKEILDLAQAIGANEVSCPERVILLAGRSIGEVTTRVAAALNEGAQVRQYYVQFDGPDLPAAA